METLYRELNGDNVIRASRPGPLFVCLTFRQKTACLWGMESDEDMLFRRAANPAADKLRREARKLKRLADRKAWWQGRKQEKRDGQ